MRRAAAGEEYLQLYPELRRWINQCIACGSAGYRPDMPESIVRVDSAAARTIRKLFAPLAVDELGLCDDCGAALERANHP